MKTKIICPKDRVEEVFKALMDHGMVFEFHYRVECWFIVPHVPPIALRHLLKKWLPLSRTAPEFLIFSELP